MTRTRTQGGTADRGRSSRLAVVALAALVALSVVAVLPAPAAAHADGATPSFLVELEESGDATVTLTMMFDLESEDERDAFRTLRNDSAVRTDTVERFRDRMATVAADASNATGREMRVDDAAVELSTADDGSVGVVELSVAWSNLAAVDGDRLVVTEPFASGFQPDRAFAVRGPSGYELTGSTPESDETGDGTATWSAGTDLSDFKVTFAPAEDGPSDGSDGTDGTDGSDGSGDGSGNDGDDGAAGIGAPGVGVVGALAALLLAGIAAARRR